MKNKKSVIAQKGQISWHTFLGDTAGCGHIRVIFPNLCFYQYKHNNSISFSPYYGASFIGDPNYYRDKMFVILQRSATENHLKMVQFLKSQVTPKTGLKVFYEIDDNLLDIPDWNFASNYYNQNKDTVKQIIGECHGVITSTPRLKKEMQKINKNVVTIGNKLPKFLWGKAESYKPIQRKKPRIVWAGSANHFALPNSDKVGGDFGNDLLEFIKRTVDNYEWVFIGAIPNELQDVKDKLSHLPWQKALEYPAYLKSLKADVGIAPLSDNTFNNSKSWIKAQELVAAGVPGVYSNVEPYQGLNNTCDTDEEMIDKIKKLCKNEKFRKETFDNDYNTVKNHLFWEENNNLSKYMNNILSLVNKKLP